jgi:2-polyprenyl-6-methoxyphenol hydroxylase-like FAD-dependent oxidoreductase
VRALDWLGLGAQLRARGMAQGAAGIRTASGLWLRRTRIEELQQRFGAPTFALHRSDLHKMLMDANRGAGLRTGHRGDLGRPRHGSAVTTYDGPYGQGHGHRGLVVAADVVHSRLRAVLFPEHAGPTDAGYITWRGLVPARRHRRSGSTRL